MNLKDMTVVQLLNELDDIYNEIRSRHKNGDLIILKDGTVMPKYCPNCNSIPTVNCVELNLSPEQIDAINKSQALGKYSCERWDNFFEREWKAGRMSFPYGWTFSPWSGIPHRAGRFYRVYCDCYATGWKESQRAAEDDFWREHTFNDIQLNRVPLEDAK